jgi:hypothetical protein
LVSSPWQQFMQKTCPHGSAAGCTIVAKHTPQSNSLIFYFSFLKKYFFLKQNKDESKSNFPHYDAVGGFTVAHWALETQSRD